MASKDWPEMDKGAVFSDGGREGATHRYSLYRDWDSTKPRLMIVGLNPSTADDRTDDPTIRRCIQFALDWGMYGGLAMTNLFAYRSTDPKRLRELRRAVAVGECNNPQLKLEAQDAGLVVAAWGIGGELFGRAKEVVDSGVLGNFAVLKLTAAGHPSHPLYLRKDSKPLNPLTLAPKEDAYAS